VSALGPAHTERGNRAIDSSRERDREKSLLFSRIVSHGRQIRVNSISGAAKAGNDPAMLSPRRDRLLSLRSNADSQRETQPGRDGRPSDSQQNSIQGPPVSRCSRAARRGMAANRIPIALNQHYCRLTTYDSTSSLSASSNYATYSAHAVSASACLDGLRERDSRRAQADTLPNSRVAFLSLAIGVDRVFMESSDVIQPG